jgi:sensor histidine kinase YesM
MKFELRQTDHSARFSFGKNFFIPLISVLTLLAFMHTLQTFYFFQHRPHILIRFVNIGLPILVYYWYFIVVAYAVRWLAQKMPLEKGHLLRIIVVHLEAVTISFFVHQSLSLAADTTIWGWKWKANLLHYKVLNNPSIWMEVIGYGFFLLTFYLTAYRKKTEEDHLMFSQLEEQLVQSKLQELRSKIHPQFLFNTLETIEKLLKIKKTKEANKVLTALSDFLRITVYTNETEQATVWDDLSFLRQYIEIEKIRLPEAFTYEEETDREARDAVIPNFILQPVVERILDRSTGQHSACCHIRISVKKSGGWLLLEIDGRSEALQDPNPVSIGSDDATIMIVQKRLQQLYAGNQEFSLTCTPEEGLRICIKIPFWKKRENPQTVLYMENEK